MKMICKTDGGIMVLEFQLISFCCERKLDQESHWIQSTIKCREKITFLGEPMKLPMMK